MRRRRGRRGARAGTCRLVTSFSRQGDGLTSSEYIWRRRRRRVWILRGELAVACSRHACQVFSLWVDLTGDGLADTPSIVIEIEFVRSSRVELLSLDHSCHDRPLSQIDRHLHNHLLLLLLSPFLLQTTLLSLPSDVSPPRLRRRMRMRGGAGSRAEITCRLVWVGRLREAKMACFRSMDWL